MSRGYTIATHILSPSAFLIDTKLLAVIHAEFCVFFAHRSAQLLSSQGFSRSSKQLMSRQRLGNPSFGSSNARAIPSQASKDGREKVNSVRERQIDRGQGVAAGRNEGESEVKI